MFEFLNRANLCGTAVTEPQFSNEVPDRRFYKFTLAIQRKSGYVDNIIIMADEKTLQDLLPLKGQRLAITGSVRTYNEKTETESHVRVFVFADRIEQTAAADENRIELRGFLTKEAIVRQTPLGKIVCDYILATQRNPYRRDYLPCIAWGSVAERVGTFPEKTEIVAMGRIQSRIYTKTIEDETVEMVAYEVSVNRIYT